MIVIGRENCNYISCIRVPSLTVEAVVIRKNRDEPAWHELWPTCKAPGTPLSFMVKWRFPKIKAPFWGIMLDPD